MRLVKVIVAAATCAAVLLAGCRQSAEADGGSAKATYTVTFEKNAADATGTMASQTFTEGEEQALSANAFERTGYRFTGWAESADGGKKYDDKASITVGADLTLYAQWTKADMLLIPAGTFQMGSDDTNASSDEKPVHSVTLTKSFYLCDHEVTQAEWKAVFGNNPSRFDGSSGKEAADGEAQDERPVERVNWYMAIAYCNKLSLKEGLEPCYSVSGVSDWASLAYGDIPTSNDSDWNAATCDFAKTGYRLPTEAEWEYAARGGIETTTERAWAGTASETELGDYAWYGVNSESKTHEVKKKKPNGYGLYDMSGNVWEWCWDWWPNTGDYADDKDGATDPAGPSSGSYRVKRGGSWYFTARLCAVSCRNYDSPDYLYDDLGFRVVRSSSE